MTRYFRVMLGEKSKFANEAYEGNYIGLDVLPYNDFAGKFHENWKEFNKEFIPIYLNQNPEKTKIMAGLACGSLWSFGKGLRKGDTVLCPDGEGIYYVGEITGEYEYHKETNLPHRRSVKWFSINIERAEMSNALRISTGAVANVSDINRYAEEIKEFLKEEIIGPVDDPIAFALEKHLEEFLVQNWNKTELGQKYDLYEENGELIGRQYPTDTGPMDLLAISKDRKELLVVELKKGRVSDNVVGQIQRYMGYVKEEMTEKDQTVKGVIIGLDDDLRIKRALSVTNNIEFYKYKVNFTLYK